jgi:Uncharacterized membrane protein
MSDGLTVPFALAALLSGAHQPNSMVLTVGMAGTVAGALIMAIGGYLTNKKERAGAGNMADIYRNLDLIEAAEDVEKENEDWANKTMQAELPPPHPAASALVIGLSYIAGGLVPLTPFIFMHDALPASAAITLSSIFIFSFFKSRITGEPPWLGALLGTLTAALAAGAAFGVAYLFR